MGVKKRRVAREGKNIIFSGGGEYIYFSDQNIDPCFIQCIKKLVIPNLGSYKKNADVQPGVIFDSPGDQRKRGKGAPTMVEASTYHLERARKPGVKYAP